MVAKSLSFQNAQKQLFQNCVLKANQGCEKNPQHFNNIHKITQLTVEVQQERFLDVKLMVSNDGTLEHILYRKPTHTDTYLYAKSQGQKSCDIISVYCPSDNQVSSEFFRKRIRKRLDRLVYSQMSAIYPQHFSFS